MQLRSFLAADLIAAELPRVSPPGGITFTHRDIEAHIGGHAANVSADLMRLGLKPGEVGCVGAVGNDPFADFFERTLSADGVELNLQRTTRARTSVDLILVVKGEDRRYHVGVGALSYLDPDFVIWAVKEDRPAVFYAGGVGLADKFDHGLADVLREVKRLGCQTFVDPVMPYNKTWHFLRKALRWTDIFHCNDVEALSLTRQKDLPAAVDALLDKDGQTTETLPGSGHRGWLRLPADSVGAFVVKAYAGTVLNPSLSISPVAATWSDNRAR